MKYVVGWLKLKPGMRDELLVRIRPFAAMTRTEAGVSFFEVNPSDGDPDVAVFIECYDSEEAHQRHQVTPEHQALLSDIAKISVEGRFEHIYAERSSSSVFKF